MMHASVALVGTFPPTECGLATFTRSSATAISEGRRVGVVELADAPRGGVLSAMVCATLVRGDRQSLRAAVKTLEGFDAVVIQHEFGIFGGPDGDEVLDLVEALDTAVIVVFHTILEEPSEHQRFVIEELARKADAVVTLSETARLRLLHSASVDPDKVIVIPHGAHEVASADERCGRPLRRQVVLTWGLLGPGKGIEHAIDAIAQLSDMVNPPEYWVVGQTHPKIRARDGEAYRKSLIDRAEAAGCADRVKFFDGYRELQSLHRLIAQADVVALPYDSREQVTSGVLVEAIAAGLPVVATGFPHAREMLATGSGLVVAHEDPRDLANALRRILTDDGLRAQFARSARKTAPSLLWPAVGRSFGQLIDRCVAARARSHDPIGMSA